MREKLSAKCGDLALKGELERKERSTRLEGDGGAAEQERRAWSSDLVAAAAIEWPSGWEVRMAR